MPDASTRSPNLVATKRVHAVPFLESLGISDLEDLQTLIKMVKRGHVEILEWFLKKSEKNWHPYVVSEAARFGHLHVLKWAEDKKLEFPPAEYYSQAAASGNLEVLQWVTDRGAPLDDAFKWACLGCNVHVLDWLLERGRTPRKPQECFMNAATKGHVAIFRWMEAHGWMPYCSKADIIQSLAARNGHVNILRWIKKRRYPVYPEICSIGAEWGFLDVVK
jgi:hypothetical protein